MGTKFNHFLFFGCPHFTMTAPQNRKENYGPNILAKIRWTMKKAKELQANPVCLGDWFHKKTGVTELEKNMLMDILLGENVITVLGNHDIQAYNPNTQTQAIGILEKAECVDLCGEWMFFNGDGRSIQVTAENYHADYDVPETFSRAGEPGTAFHIHLTHGMLTNQRLPYASLHYEDIEVNADLLINGHNHEPWFVEEEGIYNPGSMARIAMTENGITKVPMCLYVEINEPFGRGENKYQWIPIPHEEDVWLKTTTRETMTTEEADKFIESLKETGKLKGETTILAELLTKVDMEIYDGVKRKVNELLEKAKANY